MRHVGLPAAVEDGRPGKRFVVADLKAAFQRFQSDQMSDFAAALTYYSLMSLFPALLFAVAVLGVFGQESLIDETADYLKDRRRAGGHRGCRHVRARLGAVAAQHGDHGARARPRDLAQQRVGRVRRRRARAQPRLARRGGSRLRAPQGSTTCCGRWS